MCEKNKIVTDVCEPDKNVGYNKLYRSIIQYDIIPKILNTINQSFAMDNIFETMVLDHSAKIRRIKNDLFIINLDKFIKVILYPIYHDIKNHIIISLEIMILHLYNQMNGRVVNLSCLIESILKELISALIKTFSCNTDFSVKYNTCDYYFIFEFSFELLNNSSDIIKELSELNDEVVNMFMNSICKDEITVDNKCEMIPIEELSSGMMS